MTATLTGNIRVTDPADLSYVHVAKYQNGTRAWVDTEQAEYVLLKVSSLVPNGLTVVAPASGAPIAGGASTVWVRVNGTPSTTSIWIAPGSSKNAEISAVVGAGFTGLLVDGGTYGLDAPITGFVTGSGLLVPNWTSGAFLVPNYAGVGASSASNALVKVESTIGAAVGTLTATSYVDDTTITCTGTVAAGTPILIESDRTTFDWYTNVGLNVVRDEVAIVLSSTPSGPNFILALDRPLAQNHGLGAGSVVYTITSFVRDVTLRGIDFKMEGGSIAVGALFTAVDRSHFEILGAGASLGLMTARRGSRGFGSRGNRCTAYHRGQNNRVLNFESAHEMFARLDWDRASTLGSKHANGYPRGLVTCQHRCYKIDVDGQIGNGNTGAVLWGACDSDLTNMHVADTLFTDRAALDPDLITMSFGEKGGAAGFETMAVDPTSAEAEFPTALRIGGSCTNTRVPSGNVQQASVFVTDEAGITIERMQLINTGADPTAAGRVFNGILIFDAIGAPGLDIWNVNFQGVQSALLPYGGVARVHIGHMEWAPQAAFFSATALLGWGFSPQADSIASPIVFTIDDLTLWDEPSHIVFDPGGLGTPNAISRQKLLIRHVRSMNIPKSESENVEWALDVSGGAAFTRSRGDVAQLRKPLVCTFAANVVTTASNHNWPTNTPVYLAKQNGGGGSLPAGLTTGLLYYWINTGALTGQLSLTPSGGAVAFGAGVATTVIQAVHLCFEQPTSIDPWDKVTLYNGIGYGAGLALPGLWYLVSRGPAREIGVDATQTAQVSEYLDPTIGTWLATVNNASANPLGIVQTARPTATAGTVAAKGR